MIVMRMTDDHCIDPWQLFSQVDNANQTVKKYMIHVKKKRKAPTCSTVQGGPLYRLGPINWSGDALWLKTGSVRIVSPSISTRTVAWPSQVTLIPG